MDLSDFLAKVGGSDLDELYHHGVLGQKWGIRRDRDSSGSGYDLKAFGARVESLTGKDKSVLKSAGMSPSQAPAMEAKYGPDSAGDSKRHLTPTQKKLIVGGIVAAAVVGVGVYEYKTNSPNASLNLLKEAGVKEPDFSKEEIDKWAHQVPSPKEPADPTKVFTDIGVKKATAQYLVEADAESAKRLAGLTVEDAAKLGSEDLTLEPGHILSRVSTEAEKEVNSSGFYASHKPEDVERYKAVLPVYWKLWPKTAGKTSGYVNHYAADKQIRIASEKTVFDTIKKSLGDEVTVGGTKTTLKKYINSNVNGQLGLSDDETVRSSYHKIVGMFVDPTDTAVSHITKVLTSAGYHGIVDGNDAGALSASPIKIISSEGFKIVGNEALSESAISSAQDAIASLAQMISWLYGITGQEARVLASDFIEHHGVLGQKWGVHRAESQARSDANEHVKAKLFYGEGAGTRRKLIKAKVEQRSKNPVYKKAFDEAVAGQNLDKRAAQATRTRKRKDIAGFIGKTTRGVHRQLSGGFGPVTATAATIAAGAAYAHSTGLDKAVLSKVKSAATSKSAQEATRAWLKSQGIG